MCTLTKSLWHCHRVGALGDGGVFGDRYLAVVPEEKCVFMILPMRIGNGSKVRIVAFSIWYEMVMEQELRISLIKRGGSRWTKVFYREEDDFLQWSEPRNGEFFNMFGSKVDWGFLDGEYLVRFEEALERARKIKLHNVERGMG
ncbi:MAG: hypothetical protein ACSHX6_05245 [Akkermansiaceae bacterium]